MAPKKFKKCCPDKGCPRHTNPYLTERGYNAHIQAKHTPLTVETAPAVIPKTEDASDEDDQDEDAPLEDAPREDAQDNNATADGTGEITHRPEKRPHEDGDDEDEVPATKKVRLNDEVPAWATALQDAVAQAVQGATEAVQRLGARLDGLEGGMRPCLCKEPAEDEPAEKVGGSSPNSLFDDDEVAHSNAPQGAVKPVEKLLEDDSEPSNGTPGIVQASAVEVTAQQDPGSEEEHGIGQKPENEDQGSEEAPGDMQTSQEDQVAGDELESDNEQEPVGEEEPGSYIKFPSPLLKKLGPTEACRFLRRMLGYHTARWQVDQQDYQSYAGYEWMAVEDLLNPINSITEAIGRRPGGEKFALHTPNSLWNWKFRAATGETAESSAHLVARPSQRFLTPFWMPLSDDHKTLSQDEMFKIITRAGGTSEQHGHVLLLEFQSDSHGYDRVHVYDSADYYRKQRKEMFHIIRRFVKDIGLANKVIVDFTAPCAKQGRGTTKLIPACALHVILNGWTRALNLFPNPKFGVNYKQDQWRSFYREGIQMVNLVLSRHMDSATLYAWIVCKKWAMSDSPNYNDIAQTHGFTASWPVYVAHQFDGRRAKLLGIEDDPELPDFGRQVSEIPSRHQSAEPRKEASTDGYRDDSEIPEEEVQLGVDRALERRDHVGELKNWGGDDLITKLEKDGNLSKVVRLNIQVKRNAEARARLREEMLKRKAEEAKRKAEEAKSKQKEVEEDDEGEASDISKEEGDQDAEGEGAADSGNQEQGDEGNEEEEAQEDLVDEEPVARKEKPSDGWAADGWSDSDEETPNYDADYDGVEEEVGGDEGEDGQVEEEYEDEEVDMEVTSG